MKSKHIPYLSALAIVLCLTSCGNNASMHMEKDGCVSPESEDEYSFTSDEDYECTDEEDSRSFEEIQKETDSRLAAHRQEREASDWYKLEVNGGLHQYVPTKYSKKCSCTSLMRPFRCTKGYIVMLCEECYDIYLLPGAHEFGGDILVRPTGNTLEACNTIQELGCELFAAGETGWAEDTEVRAYNWEKNREVYNEYQKNKHAANSTPVKQSIGNKTTPTTEIKIR